MRRLFGDEMSGQILSFETSMQARLDSTQTLLSIEKRFNSNPSLSLNWKDIFLLNSFIENRLNSNLPLSWKKIELRSNKLKFILVLVLVLVLHNLARYERN